MQLYSMRIRNVMCLLDMVVFAHAKMDIYTRHFEECNWDKSTVLLDEIMVFRCISLGSPARCVIFLVQNTNQVQEYIKASYQASDVAMKGFCCCCVYWTSGR